MGSFDEIKGDFLKMVVTLGIILGCVFLFRLWLVSIWLVIGILVVGLGGYFMWKSSRAQ